MLNSRLFSPGRSGGFSSCLRIKKGMGSGSVSEPLVAIGFSPFKSQRGNAYALQETLRISDLDTPTLMELNGRSSQAPNAKDASLHIMIVPASPQRAAAPPSPARNLRSEADAIVSSGNSARLPGALSSPAWVYRPCGR